NFSVFANKRGCPMAARECRAVARSTMKKALVATILFGLMTVGVAAQDSLRAAAEQGSWARHVDPHADYGHGVTLADIVQRGDLIVRGVILSANSRLISGDTMIVTDYNVQVLDRFYAREN